jgi:hypothetical protein
MFERRRLGTILSSPNALLETKEKAPRPRRFVRGRIGRRQHWSSSVCDNTRE